MTKYTLWSIIVLLLIACSSVPRAAKIQTITYVNTYVDSISELYVVHYKQIRKFELIFISDTICVFRNTFFCRDIAKEYQVIDQICRYVFKDNLLIVNDVNEVNGDKLFIDIPIQDSKQCRFFTEEGHRMLIGGLGMPYDLYGRVANITNDTLYFKGDNPNVIFLYKTNIDKSESIYCKFEKQQSSKQHSFFDANTKN